MKFKVGEIAIIQNLINDITNDGTEVEVIEDLDLRSTRFKVGIVETMCYVVRRPDGLVWHCLPHQLRKKESPDVSTWEDFKKVCGFDPTKVTA